MLATISRERVYHRSGRVQWTRLYAVAVGGTVYKGTGLGWARGLARRKGATAIAYSWM